MCKHRIIKILNICFGQVIGTCRECGDTVQRDAREILPYWDI